MPVEMLKTLACLARDSSNLPLRHQVRSDDVRQRTALHVLHDYPELILMQERVDVVDDVRMPRRPHDEDLVDDEVLLRLLVQVHLLDRHRQVRADLVRGVDTSGRTIR